MHQLEAVSEVFAGTVALADAQVARADVLVSVEQQNVAVTIDLLLKLFEALEHHQAFSEFLHAAVENADV